jgi:hypothetical protein
MSLHQIRTLLTCDSATTAVELAFVLPALAALMVGGLYTGVAVYSAAGLHQAVEQAARCYSVNAGQCGSESAAQTYAQSQYYGVNSPTFTASIQTCGHQVAATVTIRLSRHGKFERAPQCDGLLPMIGTLMDRQLIAAFWQSSNVLLTRLEIHGVPVSAARR